MSAESYRARIEKVIHYIAGHLDDELNLEQLARLANFSRFHFHRQFSAYTGVSANKLLQLQRMKRACYQLGFQQMSITDIAFGARYENSESFSRAFKNLLGLTPSEFRQQANWESWLTTFADIPRETTMIDQKNVELSRYDDIRLAVYEHRGPVESLNYSLQRFVAWRKERGLSLDQHATYNIVYDDPALVSPQDYRFDIGVRVTTDMSDATAGIVTKTISGGRCARLRHFGSSDNIGDSINFLFGQWLPASGEATREVPMFFHRVKLYPAQVPEREQITDIYLPLL